MYSVPQNGGQFQATAGKAFHVHGTRKVAWIKYGTIAYRKLGSSREILRKPEESIAFRVGEVYDMQCEGVREIVVDDHTGRRLRTSLEKFLASGEEFNYGFGPQIRLPLRLWSKVDDTVSQPSLFDEVPS